MKKIFWAACTVSLLGAGYVSAHIHSVTMDVQTQGIQDEKRLVNVNALPEAVKNTLSGEAYAGWVVTAAFLVKGAAEYYEIELKRGEETTTLRLNHNGQPI